MNIVPFARPLPGPPSVKDIIKLYKLSAKKQLSQNFLLDMNMNRKIVRVAGNVKDAYVCEVGPGPGGITRAILEAGAKQLTVIEKDKRFMPGLDLLNEACDGKMKVLHGDVLNFDMANVFPKEDGVPWEEGTPNIHIIGNLPFSISTTLLLQYLESISTRSGAWSKGRVKLTLTFQKEIAERLTADIRNRQRSRLSIMAQYLCFVTHKFTIPGSVFVPKPDVDVGVVHFIPKRKADIDQPFKLVEKVVRHVFHYRQKMITRGIQTLFPPDRPEFTKFIFECSAVPPDTRSFQLTVQEFGRLCDAYRILCDNNPGLFEYDYRAQDTASQWRKSSDILKPDL